MSLTLKGWIQLNFNEIHIRGLHLRPTGSLPFLPVDGDGQQAAHRRHDGDADHGVKHVVQLPDEVIFRYQLLVVKKVNDDGLRGVGHAHQHVRHRQTATSKPANFLLALSLFMFSHFLCCHLILTSVSSWIRAQAFDLQVLSGCATLAAYACCSTAHVPSCYRISYVS